MHYRLSARSVSAGKARVFGLSQFGKSAQDSLGNMSTKVRIIIGDPNSQSIYTGSRALRILEAAHPEILPEDAGQPRWQRAINIYRRLVPQVRMIVLREPSSGNHRKYLQTIEAWRNIGIPRRANAPQTMLNLDPDREPDVRFRWAQQVFPRPTGPAVVPEGRIHEGIRIPPPVQRIIRRPVIRNTPVQNFWEALHHEPVAPEPAPLLHDDIAVGQGWADAPQLDLDQENP